MGGKPLTTWHREEHRTLKQLGQFIIYSCFINSKLITIIKNNKMSYVSYSNIITIGETYGIYAKGSGFYTNIMKAIKDQTDAFLSHHSKVYVMRFDLRQLEYTLNNSRMTVFNRRLFKRLRSKYNFLRIGFIWCREQESSDYPHYHYALLLDGHKVQHSKNIWPIVKSVWETMDGSPYLPKNCYCNINRGNHKEIQDVIYRLSYFAKAKGKDKTEAQTNNFSTSRIPIKESKNKFSFT